VTSDEAFTRLARRAYVSYHQDGLLDLLIGGVMLSVGLGIASSWAGSVALLSFFIVGVSYAIVKDRVTIPRMGFVEFPPDPRRKTLIRVVYPLLVCTFMLVLLLVGDVPPGATPVAPVWTPSRAWPNLKLWMQGKSLVLFGVAALIVLGVVAFGTRMRRLYAYALLGLVIPLGGHLLHQGTHVPVLALGTTIFAVGMVVFVRFIRSHPVRPDGPIDAGEHANDAAG
jgi:hypothetical protein